MPNLKRQTLLYSGFGRSSKFDGLYFIGTFNYDETAESNSWRLMKLEMRQKLAREPYPEKIRKVAQLIRLAKTFPRQKSGQPVPRAGK